MTSKNTQRAKLFLSGSLLPHYAVALVVLLASAVHADTQGYIVTNGITYSAAGSMAVIHVLQNPTNGDYAGLIVKPEFKLAGDTYNTICLFTTLPGSDIRTFLTFLNDPLDVEAIQANSYPELSSGSLYGFDLDVPFYLGFYTGSTNGAPAGLYSSPVFGWAELVNHDGAIQFLDSASAMEAGGIYVGTQAVIATPEPAVLSLVVFGVLLLGRRLFVIFERRNFH
jgi:hypothetical protein